MKWCLALLLAAWPHLNWAESQVDEKGALTLARFLDDVKEHNPDARAAVENIASFTDRTREAEVPLMPEAYANYTLRDDLKPPVNPLMGTETRTSGWTAGVRQQTQYGLGADLSYTSQHTQVDNASPFFLPYGDYYDSSAQLKVTQSFWRNGFGESTRAEVEANRAATDIQLLQNKFKLKTILLNAENAYWSVVSYNQVVKLQQENVDRARRLRDYFDKRTRMKLFDDTDAMQAQASLEARELELQTSLDERAMIVRTLNTLRGSSSDNVGDLESLPPRAMMLATEVKPTGKMSREDFDMLRAQAKADREKARYAQSQIQPQLDFVGLVATNGHDGLAQTAYWQSDTNHFPTWQVGVMFSVPLDFGLVRDLRRGFRRATAAAENADEQARYSEARAWDDLVKQKKEAQGRYERSLSVEKIQTELIKREHRRLRDGRATTFETINFEQNLALSQIQRVRAQLALLQIHNAIQTFEAAR